MPQCAEDTRCSVHRRSAALPRSLTRASLQRGYAAPVPSIGSAIAIASGKRGVGKSTVALNLALALGEDARVGILDAGVYGPNIVVGPQDVAHLDAKRVLELFVHTSARVCGGVENMSGFSCPHCGEAVEIFTPVRQDRSLWTLGVRKLAALPLDPALGA